MLAFDLPELKLSTIGYARALTTTIAPSILNVRRCSLKAMLFPRHVIWRPGRRPGFQLVNIIHVTQLMYIVTYIGLYGDCAAKSAQQVNWSSTQLKRLKRSCIVRLLVRFNSKAFQLYCHIYLLNSKPQGLADLSAAEVTREGVL